jgi:hypothetical protein
MVADAQRDVADFVDRAEIERPAPDERLDLGEEALPSAMSPAQARARMKAARSHGSAELS